MNFATDFFMPVVRNCLSFGSVAATNVWMVVALWVRTPVQWFMVQRCDPAVRRERKAGSMKTEDRLVYVLLRRPNLFS